MARACETGRWSVSLPLPLPNVSGSWKKRLPIVGRKSRMHDNPTYRLHRTLVVSGQRKLTESRVVVIRQGLTISPTTRDKIPFILSPSSSLIPTLAASRILSAVTLPNSRNLKESSERSRLRKSRYVSGKEKITKINKFTSHKNSRATPVHSQQKYSTLSPLLKYVRLSDI